MAKYDIEPSDAEKLQEIVGRFNVTGDAYSDKKTKIAGGRASYRQPIDDDSSLEIGAAGHYAKGKGWKDKGIDKADLTYSKRFKDDSELRARVGANLNPMTGKRGVDSVGVEYEIPFSKGGKVSKASKRADGIAQRGKTKGRIV